MIYFIIKEDLHAVKIGYSKHPEKRLKEFETYNDQALHLLFVIESGDYKLEKVFHDFLKNKNKHIIREWFRYDIHVRSYLNDIYEWMNNSHNILQFNESILHEIQHERSWNVFSNNLKKGIFL